MPPNKVRGRSVKEGERWVTVRIPQSAHAQLERLAYEQERSVSWVARKMILAELADRQILLANAARD